MSGKPYLTCPFSDFDNHLFISYGKKDQNYKAFTIGNSFVFTLSSLILKDWSCVPTKGSSRIVFFL